MAMGPIEADGKRVRKATNDEINMVPMIDLMVCCISFLLITAVWSHMARINSNALVPGGTDPVTAAPEPRLHVDARTDGAFTLTWRQGSTVINTFEVPRVSQKGRFADLGSRIAAEWAANGAHRDPSDRSFDQAVLHTGDQLPFGEIVSIIDAIHAPKRRIASLEPVPAFNVTFATN
jgi:biopolymer transport protein ExbD